MKPISHQERSIVVLQSCTDKSFPVAGGSRKWMIIFQDIEKHTYCQSELKSPAEMICFRQWLYDKMCKYKYAKNAWVRGWHTRAFKHPKKGGTKWNMVIWLLGFCVWWFLKTSQRLLNEKVIKSSCSSIVISTFSRWWIVLWKLNHNISTFSFLGI